MAAFVLVLGDRIEAFAAACAASIGGFRVAHIHGGDRAEGIADEAMRHAITKLAHLHFPATAESASRIERMGEHPSRIHVVGSTAIDDLADIAPLTDAAFAKLGSPQIVFLIHPLGRDEPTEEHDAASVLRSCTATSPTLAIDPNHDPGRNGIIRAIESVTANAPISRRPHLPRQEFIALLKRARVIVGNSSAGLIESAAIGTWAVNIGPRQRGRERPGNVIDVPGARNSTLSAILADVLQRDRYDGGHPYGDGSAGLRIAKILATVDFDTVSIRKQNTY